MSYALSPYRDPIEATGETLDDRLAQLREWVTTSEDSTSKSRTEGERARDYYDGKQLTAEELSVLSLRGQPPVVDNRVKPKVNYLLGMEKKGRTDPRAFPRNPDDEEGANAATDAIRYVCDENLFEDPASAVCENILVEGYGGVDVYVERRRGEVKICIRHYAWDRLFYDPHSCAPDFSDAKFQGGMVWMDEDSVIARWPDRADVVIAGTYAFVGSNSTTWEDRPRNIWEDRKRKRIRVIQIHWTEGDVWWCAVFTGGGFLEDPAESPYLDKHKKPECSLVIQSGYVDRENVRYGVVRDMFDPQDEVNKRRSKALHLLSVRQVVAEQGAVEDVDHARRELARPDGYIEINPTMRFDIQETGDLAQGQFLLLQEAKESMAAAGPNAFLQGKQSQASSGRAIALSQQGGAIEIDGSIMDRFHQFKRRVYRAIWNRIKQFWTEEKWVRITDDEAKVRFVGLNRPVTLADKLAKMPPQIQQQAAQYLQLAGPDDPRLQEPMIGPDGQPEIANNVAQMDVDIVIDESPDVASLQIEQFQMMADLAGKIPGFPLDSLIEASSLRNKDKILKKMQPPTGPDGQPVPPPPPPEVMRMKAEMELKQQSAQADMQMAQAKLQMDAQTAQQTAGLAQQQAQQASANDNVKMQAQIALDQARLDGEMRLQAMRIEGEMRLAEMEMQGKLQLMREEAAAKIEISRETSRQNADIRREAASDKPPAKRPPMKPHATGGLIKRTMPADDFRSRLPPIAPYADMGMQIDPSALSEDTNVLQEQPVQHYPPFPIDHTEGGPVAQMAGPNPTGPDDGYITAQEGEYVIRKSAVDLYGTAALDALNAGEIDPQALARSG